MSSIAGLRPSRSCLNEMDRSSALKITVDLLSPYVGIEDAAICKPLFRQLALTRRLTLMTRL